MIDDPAEIRRAFDTLGIDPAEIAAADDYGAELGLIVLLRDAATRLAEGERPPVTRHTPPGTEIWHPDYFDDGYTRLFVLPQPSGGFVYDVGGYFRFAFDYASWREVRRPEPVPVEVGQWRAMPVQVRQVDVSPPTANVRLPGWGDQVRLMGQVESWPVIPPPERTEP